LVNLNKRESAILRKFTCHDVNGYMLSDSVLQPLSYLTYVLNITVALKFINDIALLKN